MNQEEVNSEPNCKNICTYIKEKMSTTMKSKEKYKFIGKEINCNTEHS